ncbi:MAG TPA: sialidase family protein [Bryobacteraceae bacterium]|nr:sialidase family protein [Bryobacteraceae bacterium]
MKHTVLLSGMLLAGAGLAGAQVWLEQPARRVTVVEGGGYFPVAIRLRSGEILAVLRGGAPHIGVKGRLEVVTSRDGGATWSAPQTVVDGPDDDRNPAFGQLSDGTIVLGYAIARGYDATGLRFTGDTRRDHIFDGVYVTRSGDGGRTWSKPERSPATFALAEKGAISPYGKIVQLADGTAVMAVYYEFYDGRGNQSYIFRSKDGGKTWDDPTLLGGGYNETGIAVLADGTMLAALRTEKGGRLDVRRSTDQGRTWSEPVQVTDDREHPADLIPLKDGRVLLTYGERNRPYGARVMLSRDGGRTWERSRRILLAGDAVVTDCGYPSSVQLPDGRIVTLYYQVDDPANALPSAKAKAVIWEVPR